MGIERAYRGMNARALTQAPFTVTHQNSASPFDTLRRIERREERLLARYPGLAKLSVKYDPGAIGPDEPVVLGFHGLAPQDKADMQARGAALLDDLICPFIEKLDRVVERHVKDGFDIAMVGSPDNHHLRTARQIAAENGRRCHAIVRAEDIDALCGADDAPVVLVGEVTGNTETFRATIERIETLKLPIKVRKTMCADSHARQREASELARRADVVVLVDDGGDGARSAFEVCARMNARVHRVRGAQEIEAAWFTDAARVAVVGGILIPDWTIAEVADRLRTMDSAP
jgi:4-hydroxy-3-methylbut-2-enyl diphosphate reductase